MPHKGVLRNLETLHSSAVMYSLYSTYKRLDAFFGCDLSVGEDTGDHDPLLPGGP
ncbi:unnamed protein product, partial [Staurois parvus]